MHGSACSRRQGPRCRHAIMNSTNRGVPGTDRGRDRKSNCRWRPLRYSMAIILIWWQLTVRTNWSCTTRVVSGPQKGTITASVNDCVYYILSMALHQAAHAVKDMHPANMPASEGFATGIMQIISKRTSPSYLEDNPATFGSETRLDEDVAQHEPHCRHPHVSLGQIGYLYLQVLRTPSKQFFRRFMTNIHDNHMFQNRLCCMYIDWSLNRRSRLPTLYCRNRAL